MTIVKAIENLEFHIRLGELVHHSDDIAAIKLSIEALKIINELRLAGDPIAPGLLPGETEE